MRALQRGADMVVATPGRLMDLLALHEGMVRESAAQCLTSICSYGTTINELWQTVNEPWQVKLKHELSVIGTRSHVIRVLWKFRRCKG